MVCYVLFCIIFFQLAVSFDKYRTDCSLSIYDINVRGGKCINNSIDILTAMRGMAVYIGSSREPA